MLLNKLTTPILNLPRLIKRGIVASVDASLCVLSVYVAFYLRLGEWVPLFSPSHWNPLWVVGASIALSFPIFFAFGLYREIFRHSGWFALLTLARAMTLYGVLFFIIFTVIGVDDVPRTVGIIQPLILFMLAGGSRAFASYWLSNSYRKQLKLSAVPHVLIYGAGDAGRQLMGALSHSYEMQVVGFLDDDPKLQGSTLGGKRIYAPRRLIDLTASLNVSEVLLAIPSASRFRRNQIIKLMRDAKRLSHMRGDCWSTITLGCMMTASQKCNACFFG
jgi:FlaA1/EpsC-like NDP-sugar epimerase